ncbi:hypothetical protein ABMA28_000535 [Loxostege sticticalis]|uniref:Sensory neuron membrane protein 2 n=1 Tax=Loxostege sticticalis TaxID=481309 RepID=A0ABD0TSL2_LOXSC
MCSGLICGISTVAVGTALVIVSSVLGFYLIPDVIENNIIDRVVLLNDTDQLERFQDIPFPLSFKVRVFNISNAAAVLTGSVPALTEVGPYGVLQVASNRFAGLMGALSLGMNGIFGAYNGPIAEVRVGDLLFDGIKLCQRPGIAGGIACNFIRDLSGNVQNMEVLEDNTINFSFLGYRNDKPGSLHEIYRGVEDHLNVGRITALNNMPELPYWTDAVTTSPDRCNMINGTDSGIFNPFIDTSKPLYALNTDICRSVELRYHKDMEYEGIPVVRFTANEWFLDNDEGCFCLNQTTGIAREDGCLLRGAMELYTCGITLSEEFTDRLSNDLLSTLSLVSILVPVAVALSAAVLLTGVAIVLYTRFTKTTV